MSIKQVMYRKQNTKQTFTNTLCLQNKTNVYKHVMFTKQNTKQKVYKTKIYKHVMFTKQNTKQ